MVILLGLQFIAYAILIYKKSFFLLSLLLLCDVIFILRFQDKRLKSEFFMACRRLKPKLSLYTLILSCVLFFVLRYLFNKQSPTLQIAGATELFAGFIIFVFLLFLLILIYKMSEEKGQTND